MYENHSRKKYITGIVIGFSALFIVIGVGLFMYIQSYSHASPYYTFYKSKKAAITAEKQRTTPTITPYVVTDIQADETYEIEQMADVASFEQELQSLNAELESL